MLQLVIGCYLEDAALLERQGNDEEDNTTSADDITVSKLYTDELLQYQAVRQFEGEETRLAEASAAAVASAPPDVVCVSCEDSYPSDEVWQAPCSHHYCTECLEQLHRACMTDETLYPPRCCRNEMPWDDVRVKINGRLATRFQEKKKNLTRTSASAPIVQTQAAHDLSGPQLSLTISLSARRVILPPALCAKLQVTTVTVRLIRLYTTRYV